MTGITGLTAGTTPDGTEKVHAVQGGNSRRFTFAEILAIQHTHAISDVTALQTALDNKLDDSQAGAGGLAVLGAANAAAVRAAAGLGSVSTLDSDTDTALAANSDSKIATQKAVKAYVDAAVSGGGYTDEQVRDVIGAALVAGSGVTITPNDGADTITIAASGGGSAAELDYGPPTISSLSTELKSASAFTASASDVSGKGLLLDLNPTAAANKVLARVHPASAPLTITCRMRQTPQQIDGNGESGLYIDNGSGDSLRMFMQWDGTLYCQRWNSLENWNASLGGGSVTAREMHVWLRIAVDGSGNVTASYSFDGAYWKVLATTTIGATIGSFSRAGVFGRNSINGGKSGALFPYYNES